MADIPAPRRRRAGRIVYWVLFALAVAAIVASFAWIRLAGRGFTNSSTSMVNTVRPGSTMLVEKGQGVRRGDVIALNRPDGTFIRRVIGLPGDRVACCTAGHVTVDGKPLDESYVYPGDQPSAATFSVTVGPGQLWVLGDHRSIAIDSRMWGPVQVSDVIGRVVALFGGGGPQLLLHTPQAFVTAGLAPADQRTPWVFVAFSLGIVAAPILVILIVFGVIRTLIRRNRRRRSPGAFTAGPAS
jgi:signal peptidase I